MAGHSKWKNIKIRKGKQDAIRGKIFTKISREIIVAARSGGADISLNPRLRVAVEKARINSVPRENIERSIKRGTGEIEGANYEELVYEGYGPSGAGVICQCYSENRNRTVGEVRSAFTKNNGTMADNGAVSWQFKYVGQILMDRAELDEDTVTMDALEAGAEDITVEEEGITVLTAMEDLHKVNDALIKAGYKTNEVGLTYIATNKTELSRADMIKLVKLLDVLDDLEDVQETYINVDIPEDVYEEA
jgi:YebC/PmpR family DNA-binding regulatory protein